MLEYERANRIEFATYHKGNTFLEGEEFVAVLIDKVVIDINRFYEMKYM
jgi:hypothetical protein